MPRETASRSILGEETYKKVRETPILVVGAGGIGCELCELRSLSGSDCCLSNPGIEVPRSYRLRRRADETVKNLVLVGFANIEIVSLVDYP